MLAQAGLVSSQRNDNNRSNYYQYQEGSQLSLTRGLRGRSRWRVAPVVALRYAFSPHAQHLLLPQPPSSNV